MAPRGGMAGDAPLGLTIAKLSIFEGAGASRKWRRGVSVGVER